MHKKLEIINLNEEKNQVPTRGIEPGTAQISPFEKTQLFC